MGLKISELNSASESKNNDFFVIVQNSITKKITRDKILEDTDGQIEALKEENEFLKETLNNELSDGTVTGESIVVNDSAEYYAELDINGNTKQTTYTGKNLVNNVATTRSVKGITYTKRDDGSIVASGTSTDVSTINLIENATFILPAGTYTLSGCPANGSDSTYRVDINNGTDADKKDYGLGTTFTLSENLTVNIVRIRIASGVTVNNLVFKPMIEIGSEKTTYEPYVGGQASPNPEYPQDVHVLKGSNTIKIYNENMFDGVMEQGQINTGTGLNTNSSTVIRTKNFFKIPEAVTTLKIIRTVATGAWVTREYDENKNYLGFQIKCTANVYSNQFTLLEGTRYIRFVDLSNNLNGKFCLTSNLTQEEYIEPKQQVKTLTLPNNLEMCKIENYKDEFVKDLNTNKWYKNKKIIKTVLNGSENWKLSSAWSKINTNVYYVTTINDALYESQDAVYYLTNLFIAFSRNNLVNSDVNGFAYSGNVNTNNPAFTCRIEKTLASSVADFKTLLANNNLIVYYILATPVEEEITNETLISQLEELLKVKSYFRQTNITVEAEVLEPIINFKYKRSNELRLEALENNS